jgi:hypothetical protein
MQMVHTFTVFPEISVDPKTGFDNWSNQGAITAPVQGSPPDVDVPTWLQYTSLKSPWLYVEKTTPAPHVAFTDLGDLRYINIGTSCVPTSTNHPSIVLNTPASKLHVKLEDFTNTANPKIMWDQWFSLHNTAPGGNGIRMVGYQAPVDSDSPDGGADSFIPFCFKKLNDIDFFKTKYKMTVESVADAKDISVVPWKDVMMLRPRPLCDTLARDFLFTS